MIRKALHEEIIFIANKITKIKINSSPDEYYNLVIELFEKTILLKNSAHFNNRLGLDEQLTKNNLHLITDSITKTKVDEKEAIVPLIETIKEMIPEIPENNINLFSLNDYSSNLSFEKKNDSNNETFSPVSSKLNDQFAKILKVGVNDRSAFIQKLFENKSEEYDKVMTQISSIGDWNLIKNFIQNKVKPEYSSWSDNSLIEKRFIDILKKQFT